MSLGPSHRPISVNLQGTAPAVPWFYGVQITQTKASC